MVHDKMTDMGVFLGDHEIGKKFTDCLLGYENKILEQNILGIDFKNPIGLSAGFDKDAKLTGILPSVGFGFAEVGSITGKACPGNPKPRLWRLPKSKSLAVYYGLKNEGCEKIAERLKGKKFDIPIGISVAMTNCLDNVETENGIADYAHAFRTMEPYGDYITVNVSCPNALGGQPFMIPGKLELLLKTLDKIKTSKPIFIKLSPDISKQDIDEILEIAKKYRVHGIICTNLTKKRDLEKIKDEKVPSKGGLSGKLVDELSDNLISYIYKKGGGRFVIIGSGGVFSAKDAYRKIRLGASLLQMITGMIYEGPQVISEINQGLAELLKKDGLNNISQAIGVDNK